MRVEEDEVVTRVYINKKGKKKKKKDQVVDGGILEMQPKPSIRWTPLGRDERDKTRTRSKKG